MNIVLGSTSPHKLSAVKQACLKFGTQMEVQGVKASSGQNEQPVGFAETFAGALMRARIAQAHQPQALAIGIESGIFRITPQVTLDMAVIVLLSPDGTQVVTTSQGIQFPEFCVQLAESRGFDKVTVGSVITEQFGGDPNDPHAVLSKWAINRTDTLVAALTLALQQTGFAQLIKIS